MEQEDCERKVELSEAEEVEVEVDGEEAEDSRDSVGDSVFEQDHQLPLGKMEKEETANERRNCSQLSPNAKLFSISNLLSSKACHGDLTESKTNADIESQTSNATPSKIPCFDTNFFNSQQSHSLLQKFHNFLPYATQQQPLIQRPFHHQILTEETSQNDQLQTQLKRKIPSSSTIRSKKHVQQFEKENISIPKISPKIESNENQKRITTTTFENERISIDVTSPAAASSGGSSPDGKPQCVLESKDLWEKFSELGTEMIITKTGRRMFPTIRVSFSGLERRKRYAIGLDVVSVDSKRYRYAYHRSSWLVAGKADPPAPYRLYIHPDTPALGHALESQIISFEKLKLTNNDMDGTGHIVLNSMHKYQPRIHLLELNETHKMPLSNPEEADNCHTFQFSPTTFTAVTAYQEPTDNEAEDRLQPVCKGIPRLLSTLRLRTRCSTVIV